jgi:hypothetical protein
MQGAVEIEHDVSGTGRNDPLAQLSKGYEPVMDDELVDESTVGGAVAGALEDRMPCRHRRID